VGDNENVGNALLSDAMEETALPQIHDAPVRCRKYKLYSDRAVAQYVVKRLNAFAESKPGVSFVCSYGWFFRMRYRLGNSGLFRYLDTNLKVRAALARTYAIDGCVRASMARKLALPFCFLSCSLLGTRPSAGMPEKQLSAFEQSKLETANGNFYRQRQICSAK